MKPLRISPLDFPRLTRFYGIPPSELARMPYVLLEIYAEGLKELQAEEALLGFMTADMPHLKPDERKRTHARFLRLAGLEEEVKKIDHTTEGGRAAAAALGIGIDLPDAEIESPTDDA